MGKFSFIKFIEQATFLSAESVRSYHQILIHLESSAGHALIAQV